VTVTLDRVTQALRVAQGQADRDPRQPLLSSVVNVDQLFVLDRGGFGEPGAHDQLLARRGIYSGMARAARDRDGGPRIAQMSCRARRDRTRVTSGHPLPARPKA
jgi:hypothetical protein